MNETLFQQLLSLLQEAGPWLVLLVTCTETALFIGLLVPAEATVLVASFLAYQGYFDLKHVLAATVGGALLGDQLGYLAGRLGGHRMAVSSGWIGRLWRRHERAAQRLFRRRSILAVSVARFISFVRTLMPWFAGMSRMSYGSYLAYDLLGSARLERIVRGGWLCGGQQLAPRRPGTRCPERGPARLAGAAVADGVAHSAADASVPSVSP